MLAEKDEGLQETSTLPTNLLMKQQRPFIPLSNSSQDSFSPGDIIVNQWDRGAWFTGLLPGLFPEQKLINLWEGDKNMLGYGGYDFWFSNRYDPDTFTLGFNTPNAVLPLEDNSVSLFFALDAFHRFDQSLWMQEILRVLKPDGVILFTHTHLSNNEPEPFFERGCKQMHGRDYQHYFDLLLKETGRKGYVFSEPKLFWLNDMEPERKMSLESTPEMKDYNGTLAILPESWSNKQLQALDYQAFYKAPEQTHLILNGLYSYDFSQQLISIDRDKMDGTVGHLLDRHPIYVERIGGTETISISEIEMKVLFSASQILSVAEIAKNLNIPLEQVIEIAERFRQKDIIQPLPINKQHARLQYFLSFQEFKLEEKEQTFRGLWDRACQSYADQLAVLAQAEETELSYEEADELVQVLVQRLLQAGVSKGDYIVVLGPLELEMNLVVWACAYLGAVVVPLMPEKGEKTINNILERVEPKMVFLNAACAPLIQESSVEQIYFDQEEQQLDGPEFSEWLEEVDDTQLVPLPEVAPEDPMVVLFTSGSTGVPKGVVLQHASLMRSARLITESFEWSGTDRYLALTGLDSMSGLRNACLAPIEVGACLVIPEASKMSNAFGIADTIGDTETSIIAATPPLFRQFLNFSGRLKGQLGSLKLVMSTGSNLSQELRDQFKANFNLEIYNYYGLTETCGICLTQLPRLQKQAEGNIGLPVQSIAQIVDENDQLLPLGEEGELRILSPNLMQGYLKDEAKTQAVLRDGWYYTGDLAIQHADGSISLRGRKRDIVKIASGDLIYPIEIEQQLEQFEEVKQAFVGKIIQQDAEALIAFVVPAKEEVSVRSIQTYLKNELGEHKVPSQVYIKTALPKLSNGKIDQQTLMAEIKS